jgi:hypothetical protein
MAVFSASRLRTGAAAVTATVIVLLVVVGLGNQGVESWRNTQADGKNGWVAVIFQTLQYTAWRFTAGSATTQHWLAPLVFNGVFIIATALLAGAAAHNRTRFTLFLGIWAAVLLAGGLAGLASTPLVFSGTGGATADNFRTSLNYGLLLGFMLGFVAGVISAILAGGRGTGERGAARSQAQTVAVPDTGDTTWPLSS